MKFFVVVTVAVALTVLFAGCVTMSIKVPVSRDRLAAALDISEAGINILYRLAENRGANVAEAREQSTAAFAFVRSLLVLEFRSIERKELMRAIEQLRAVASSAARLCRALEVDEAIVALHEQHVERALDTLGLVLAALPEGEKKDLT